MKKIVLAAALLLTSVATFAQHEVGDFTIQPKVGLNIANTTKTESNYKVDFVGGAEAEYQVGEIFSVSTGLLYSRQGAKAKNSNEKPKLHQHACHGQCLCSARSRCQAWPSAWSYDR